MSDNAQNEAVSAASNQRILDAFRDYLKVEKGLSKLTLEAYLRDLAQFDEFVQKHRHTLSNARRQDVREFLENLFKKGLDGRSVARKLSTLRHFYKFLLLDKHIKHDPTLNIDTPRQWKVLPKSLARSEVEKMLQTRSPNSNNTISAALALRDRALLEILYACAVRVSELCGLKLDDLKLDLGYMLVRGKGDKERVVPLGRASVDALTTYLREGRTSILQESSHTPGLCGCAGHGPHATTNLAGCGRCLTGFSSCQSAHASTQRRHAHGREWR